MKKNPNTDIASTYQKVGKKMAIQAPKGQSTTKKIQVGRASDMVKNGIYVPKPTTGAKKAAPTPKKTKFKTPTSKQTGLKKAMKVGGKGKRC